MAKEEPSASLVVNLDMKETRKGLSELTATKFYDPKNVRSVVVMSLSPSQSECNCSK